MRLGLAHPQTPSERRARPTPSQCWPAIAALALSLSSSSRIAGAQHGEIRVPSVWYSLRENLPVRSKPNLQAATIYGLRRGEAICLVEVVDRWAHVARYRADGSRAEGWTEKGFLIATPTVGAAKAACTRPVVRREAPRPTSVTESPSTSTIDELNDRVTQVLEDELRQLLTAQEIFYLDHGTYASELQQLAEFYRPQPELDIRLVQASNTSWLGEARRRARPNVVCALQWTENSDPNRARAQCRSGG